MDAVSFMGASWEGCSCKPPPCKLNSNKYSTGIDVEHSVVQQVKVGSSNVTWTAWVQFQPFPQHKLLALLAISIN